MITKKKTKQNNVYSGCRPGFIKNVRHVVICLLGVAGIHVSFWLLSSRQMGVCGCFEQILQERKNNAGNQTDSSIKTKLKQITTSQRHANWDNSSLCVIPHIRLQISHRFTHPKTNVIQQHNSTLWHVWLQFAAERIKFPSVSETTSVPRAGADHSAANEVGPEEQQFITRVYSGWDVYLL